MKYEDIKLKIARGYTAHFNRSIANGEIPMTRMQWEDYVAEIINENYMDNRDET